MNTRIFYRIVTPSTFSNLHADTLEDAQKKLSDWGECPNGTPENKEYWKKQQALCKIVKVTEITEEL